jgi:hypothetical protein
VLHLAGQTTALGLRAHLDHFSSAVHLPTVVKAPEAIVFIASVNQGRTTVRTELAHHPHVAIRIAKYHQIFAQYPSANWRAIRLTDLFNEAYGLPMSAHQLTHWCLAFNAAEQVVFFGGHHVKILLGGGFRALKIQSLGHFGLK